MKINTILNKVKGNIPGFMVGVGLTIVATYLQKRVSPRTTEDLGLNIVPEVIQVTFHEKGEVNDAFEIVDNLKTIFKEKGVCDHR